MPFWRTGAGFFQLHLALCAVSLGDIDSSIFVQRVLTLEKTLEQPQKLSFPPGSEAEVAVPAAGEGVHFFRCSITGVGAAPDSYDVYLHDVAPTLRKVSAVPAELLRARGGPGLPLDEVDALLEGRGPLDRREVVSTATARLRKSTNAPLDTRKGADLEAALKHEAAKAQALRARLEAEREESQKRQRRGTRNKWRFGWGGGGASSQTSGGGQASGFDSLDTNGDGIVTKEEFRQAAASGPAPAPELPQEQAAKAWEKKARSWDSGCQREERLQLLRGLDSLKEQDPGPALARLPEQCGPVQGESPDFEGMVGCVQNLMNTTWRCAACPVKFAISVAANCRSRCSEIESTCADHDSCFVQSSDCLECVRQPAMKLLRCAAVPGASSLEKHFGKGPLPTDLFHDGLGNLPETVVNMLQSQAWGIQRLVRAWGHDPEGFDAIGAPLLRALGSLEPTVPWTVVPMAPRAARKTPAPAPAEVKAAPVHSTGPPLKLPSLSLPPLPKLPSFLPKASAATAAPTAAAAAPAARVAVPVTPAAAATVAATVAPKATAAAVPAVVQAATTRLPAAPVPVPPVQVALTTSLPQAAATTVPASAPIVQAVATTSLAPVKAAAPTAPAPVVQAAAATSLAPVKAAAANPAPVPAPVVQAQAPPKPTALPQAAVTAPPVQAVAATVATVAPVAATAAPVPVAVVQAATAAPVPAASADEEVS